MCSYGTQSRMWINVRDLFTRLSTFATAGVSSSRRKLGSAA